MNKEDYIDPIFEGSYLQEEELESLKFTYEGIDSNDFHVFCKEELILTGICPIILIKEDECIIENSNCNWNDTLFKGIITNIEDLKKVLELIQVKIN